MDRESITKTKLLARQILLGFIDINRALAYPFFDSSRMYRASLKKYDKFRFEDKVRFSKEIYRLNQAGFIKKYYDGKDVFIELTGKGKKRVKKYISDEMSIKKSRKWDRKWRIVIFDIPNGKRKSRDYIRNRLEYMGFYKLQESVYVFPFECLDEINYLKNNYFLAPYVQYIVADRIETETNLIKIFLDREILKNNMLK
jgi:DNA-binding transcriptional regulator PaaX